MKRSVIQANPEVEKILQALGPTDLPRPAAIAVIRRELSVARSEKKVPDPNALLARVRLATEGLRRSRIQPVINATGIIVHTHFGRSPLGSAVIETLKTIAAAYTNLEFDLIGGERGERAPYLEHNLAVLCGADAATVVNNGAAALVLILRRLMSGERRDVVISRGELIQFDGGFRIPEMIEASGASLREVGTTNKTSLGDYGKAIGKRTALILKVHRSNFFVDGHAASPSTEEISELAKKKRVPLVVDLGSGVVVDAEKLADIDHEPTPEEVLRSGADLVCFSGDKLLGGPQAGIIAGNGKLVAALKKEPFFRALRCDKLILSALQTTVDLYLNGQVTDSIPALAMLRTAREELLARARRIVVALEALPMRTTIGESRSRIGGGTQSRASLPSVTLDLQPLNMPVGDFEARLRVGTPPVIGYVAGGRIRLDLRTVFPRQDEALFRAIHAVSGREIM